MALLLVVNQLCMKVFNFPNHQKGHNIANTQISYFCSQMQYISGFQRKDTAPERVIMHIIDRICDHRNTLQMSQEIDLRLFGTKLLT